jgi:XapX domain-containing protein
MIETVRDVVVSLITGGLVGFAFALTNAPVPAPPVIAGVAGILGITLGYSLLRTVLGK